MIMHISTFLTTSRSPGIGQPLSMLLKLNPAVTKLALYDIVHTPGVSWENYNFSIYITKYFMIFLT